MSREQNKRKVNLSFSDEELAVAAGKVREAMLNSLPEPEECRREFSAEFEQKMKKLFAKEKAMRTMAEIKRWAAAILLLMFIGAGTVLAVDTEARAAFFEWVRRVYENSIIYEFFNEPTDEGLPTYELGWVPEGYELLDVFQDEATYSALYQKVEDIDAAFVFEYRYSQSGSLLELYGDTERYEFKKLIIENITVDFYRSLDGQESNAAIWMDKDSEIVFFVNGYFDEDVMLHIIENMFLDNMPK